MKFPEKGVTPAILCAEDPHAGDEAAYDEGDFGNSVRFGGPTQPEAWRALDRKFHQHYLDVLAGRRRYDDPTLLETAAQLGVDVPRTHDRRRAPATGLVVDDALLATIVEDLAPDAWLYGERIVGETTCPSVAVIAAVAFLSCAADGRRPIDFWAEDERDRTLIVAVRAMAKFPPMVYGDGAALLPLAESWTPAEIPIAPFVGRGYRVGETWTWSGVVSLPARPDPGAMYRRLYLELMRLRRHERRSTFEDLLRARPEVVYRAAMESAERQAAR